MILPVLEYQNCTAKPDGCKGISVTGGYVYQGGQDAWQGKYIFGDWSKSFGEMDGQIFVGSRAGPDLDHHRSGGRPGHDLQDRPGELIRARG